jgi:DNA-binding MarR family transcriptional regulator
MVHSDMMVHVTRTISPEPPIPVDRNRVRIDTIIADFHDVLFALKCATSERLHRLGVSMAQLNILYSLQRSGEMPMSRLADVLNVSLSNATGLIDRMEERGYIERTRVPEDRRIVLVRLTAEGSRLLAEQTAQSEDLMRRVLDRLGPNQLAVVAQATGDLRAAAEATMGPLPDRHPASITTPRSPSTLRGTEPTEPITRRD